MKDWSFLRSERPVFAVMLLALTPWLGLALLAGGVWVALHTIGYALLVIAVGYALLSLLPTSGSRSQAILLAPSAGILLLSSFTALWLRLGLPVVWVSFAWMGMIIVGVTGLWLDRDLLRKVKVEYGGALIVLSLVISAIYFAPGAFKDAVLRPDGSYNWIYVDTQYFQSIAASIKYSHGPPTTPGSATEQLIYHFGACAPAAVISRITGLELGDALVRVTRGVEQWALVLSCFGVGAFLAVKATASKFGGILSVAGLFFYGSLSSLFDDQRNSSSPVSGAILGKLPGLGVLANGGPFSHIILGHSVLHGLVAITAIMGICLLQREQEELFKWRAVVFMVLPMLVIPVNSVAALYCLGIVSILLLWGHLTTFRSWLAITLMFCLFAGGWWTMGYVQAREGGPKLINLHPDHQLWWTLAVWLTVGLGLRLIAIGWMSKSMKDPVSVLVLASMVGLASFFILTELAGDQRYGIYFLQGMFSLLAFSRLAPGFYRAPQREKWVSEWLHLAKWAALAILASGMVIGLVDHVFPGYGQSGIPSLKPKLLAAFLGVLTLTGLSVLVKRGGISSAMTSALLCGILLLGFLAWIEPWLNFGMGRQKMDLTLTAGEVQGLRRLNQLSSPGERFATNRHAVPGLVSTPYRSYSYDALSERPVLMEGYYYRGNTELSGFKTLLRDNDSLFTLTNASALRDLAKVYQVRWLVARPGTDLALQRPLPPWLEEETNCGTLKIYQIN